MDWIVFKGMSGAFASGLFLASCAQQPVRADVAPSAAWSALQRAFAADKRLCFVAGGGSEQAGFGSGIAEIRLSRHPVRDGSRAVSGTIAARFDRAPGTEFRDRFECREKEGGAYVCENVCSDSAFILESNADASLTLKGYRRIRRIECDGESVGRDTPLTGTEDVPIVLRPAEPAACGN